MTSSLFDRAERKGLPDQVRVSRAGSAPAPFSPPGDAGERVAGVDVSASWIQMAVAPPSCPVGDVTVYARPFLVRTHGRDACARWSARWVASCLKMFGVSRVVLVHHVSGAQDYEATVARVQEAASEVCAATLLHPLEVRMRLIKSPGWSPRVGKLKRDREERLVALGVEPGLPSGCYGALDAWQVAAMMGD